MTWKIRFEDLKMKENVKQKPKPQGMLPFWFNNFIMPHPVRWQEAHVCQNPSGVIKMFWIYFCSHTSVRSQTYLALFRRRLHTLHSFCVLFLVLCSVCALNTEAAYTFSSPLQWLYVSRAMHALHVFPRLAEVKCFLVLDTDWIYSSVRH